MKKYPKIKSFLDIVKIDLLNILSAEDVYGMYVTGSLTSNAFLLGLSDIDLIVVTNRVVSDEVFEELKKWSKQILKTNKLANYLDVAFINKEYVKLNKKISSSSVELFKGEVSRSSDTIGDNVIVWSQILDTGVCIYGKDFSHLISKIPKEVIIKKQLEELDSLENIFDKIFPHDLKFRYYVICTLARMLYTAESGKYITKMDALDWYSNKYGKHKNLIKSAREYYKGNEIIIKETDSSKYKDFITEVKNALTVQMNIG